MHLIFHELGALVGETANHILQVMEAIVASSFPIMRFYWFVVSS